MTPAAAARLERNVSGLLDAVQRGERDMAPCERRALGSLLVDAGLMELATRILAVRSRATPTGAVLQLQETHSMNMAERREVVAKLVRLWRRLNASIHDLSAGTVEDRALVECLALAVDVTVDLSDLIDETFAAARDPSTL